MSDSRPASIYLDDIEKMETAGLLLFKHVENAVALDLLAIALRLRGQTGLGAELSKAVITGYSRFAEPPVGVVPGAAELTERETRGVQVSEVATEMGSEWPPRPRSVSFACSDIDESAGLAEVVELRGYSRKAPCA